jgi:nucleotide-binding universal stress UspA family protein
MSTLARPDDWDAPVVLPDIATPRRILVPFDGSHNAERALSWTRLIATRADAEVVVVVAYEQPLTMRGRGAAYVETLRDELAEEAMHLATEAVDLLKGEGVAARGVVVKGEPARAILDTADDEGCDIIVIGRHGLTGELRGVASALDRFRDLLQGGVVEKVSRHAAIPVLVVV